MIGELFLLVIHVAETRMIEAEIDGISRGNNLGEMIRLLNPLQFFLLDQGAVLRFDKFEPFIRNWWGEMLTSISAKYWFEHKGDNHM